MNESTPTPADRPADETIKETFESIVIAFILAFVFRAYVVEAFVIPTGSMAPTLLGAHIDVQCDQCGYEFDFDPPKEAITRSGQIGWPNRQHDEALGVVCPMCVAPNVVSRGTTINSGDRILVHKYIYSFSEPRRWDVVVFKAPHQPETNYIKRLVGLPNEQLYLFEGNVYVRPLASDDAPDGDDDTGWHIARKTDRPKVQRTVWQPIYHSNFVPRDGGQRRYDPRFDWTVPWTPRGVTSGDWDVEGRRSYRFSGDDGGTLAFDFGRSAVRNGPLVYPYNQLQPQSQMQPIEDIRLAAHVEPAQQFDEITFSTIARLNDPDINFGAEQLSATVTADGEVILEARRIDGEGARTLEHERIDPLPANRATHIEFWYADQEASIWIEGKRIVRWRYELPLDDLVERDRPRQHPEIAINVTGPVTLHNVELDRDLFYGSRLRNNVARGALIRGTSRDALTLSGDDFFCLGDNGPQSSDSRFWSDEDTNDWVLHHMLQDRVDAGLNPGGIVPRELMMGRAFFVYFPAPYSFGRIPLPNFGDMRFIR